MSEATTDVPRGWNSCPSILGELWVPSGWVEQPAGTSATAFAGKERPDSLFRENVVLSILESEGSIVEDSSAAASEAMDMQPWSHVISISPWLHSIFRRRMQFMYEHNGFTVAVSKFTATSPKGRIDLTCSVGFERYYDLSKVFDDIATFSPMEGAGFDHSDR